MKYLKILLILLVLTLLVSTSAIAKVTITLWYPEGQITAGAAHFADKTLFADFEAKNNCKVDLVGGDYDTMRQKIFTAMAAGAGRVPDILFVDRSWVPGLLKEDTLEPVSEVDAKQWLAAVTPEIVELSDYGNGQMWGYPQYGIDVYGITWNKDYFAEAGFDPERAPQTWAEFLYYSLKTSKKDAAGNLTRVGYAIRHVGHPHGVVHKFLWALWGAGADLITDPKALKGGKVLFNNEGGKAALKLVYDMIYVDESTSLNFPDPRAALLQGIAAMQISETISIQARQPKEAPNLRWGVDLPPVRYVGYEPATNLNSWFYSVPRLSMNKELTWKAIKWINSVQRDYELCAKYKSTPRYKENWAKPPFTTDPYAVALRKMLPYGRAYPNNLGLDGIMESLGAAIQKVWHNEAEIGPALAEAEELANKAIRDAAK